MKKSISANITERMVTETTCFTIDGTADGPAFLMTLIQIFFVQTKAQPSLLCLKISQAYLLIEEHEWNIDSFNTEINAYVQKLSANGKTMEDLFAHLQRAYRLVPDKTAQLKDPAKYINEDPENPEDPGKEAKKKP